MTAQIQDTFLFDGSEYELIGVQGEGLFDPTAHGFEPAMMHTACYDGFYCTYEIANDHLFLRELTICDANSNYPPIGGIKPSESAPMRADYADLEVEIPFTGTLRLARGFHEECYIHMGYQPASSYDEVVDFVFENGELRGANIMSLVLGHGSGRTHERSADIGQWIENRFSMELEE